MSSVIGTLGGVTLPNFTIPFEESPVENAVDVTTLDSTLYTDWVNKKRQWTLNWGVLNEVEYGQIYALYEGQFSGIDYPHFIISYYGIDVPVRIHINNKDIRKDGCEVWGVALTLTEQYATGFAPVHILLDGGDSLLLDNKNYLLV